MNKTAIREKLTTQLLTVSFTAGVLAVALLSLLTDVLGLNAWMFSTGILIGVGARLLFESAAADGSMWQGGWGVSKP